MSKERINQSEHNDEIPANSESLSLYIRDISNFPVLTKEIESFFFRNLTNNTTIHELEANTKLKSLIEKLKPEDQRRYKFLFQQVNDAYEAIFLSNVKLVISRAKRLYSPGIELIELIQYGNIALHKSIMNFDIERDLRFSTYAVKAIDSYITREIRQNSNHIRLPENSLIALRKIDSILNTNNLDENDEATIELLVQETKVSRIYLSSLLKYRRLNNASVTSFKEEINSAELVNLPGITKRSLDDIIIQKEMREIILNAIDTLAMPKRDKEIAKIYILGKLNIYEGDTTFESVGNQFGLTRQRIEQIIKQTFIEIRKNLAIQKMYEAINDE